MLSIVFRSSHSLSLNPLLHSPFNTLLLRCLQMSQNITRIRRSNKRIDPIPSLFIGLLQADFFFGLFYFVFCHSLIRYARSGIYIALKGKHHHNHVLKVADNAPDFLTIIWKLRSCHRYPMACSHHIPTYKHSEGPTAPQNPRYAQSSPRENVIANTAYSSLRPVLS
jgi:hypothetical protein